MNFQPARSLNGISDDLCAINKRDEESQKPMKFLTTTFKDFHDPNEMRGLNFHDGKGVPGCGIDIHSSFRNGQINTNPNLPQSLPALPLPTTGSRSGGQGDTDIEFLLRGKDTNGSKTCLPHDPEFYKRSFADFSSLCRKPQEIKHTVQKNHSQRGGVSTRNFNCGSK
jgi:hypothetical protein